MGIPTGFVIQNDQVIENHLYKLVFNLKKMRQYIFILLQIVFINTAKTQNIDTYISETKIDSLVKTVRELSGEDATIINGITTKLTNRNNAIGKKTCYRLYKKET